MPNTITLSTDMNTLYLIDDERAIPFDLTNGKGALIGTLAGQVTVITANSGGKMPESIKMTEERKSIPIKGNQWTITYNGDAELMHVVGVVDIDGWRQEGKEPACKTVLFDLRDKILSIRKVGNSLDLVSMKQKTKI